MIHLLLRAYPRAWRERYGDELAQLVDDVGLSPGVLIDLIHGGVTERRRALTNGGFEMMIGPASRHPRGMALVAAVVLAPVLVFVIGSILAYQLGIDPLRPPFDAMNAFLSSWRPADLAIVLSPAIAVLLAIAPLVRLEFRPSDLGREAVVGVRLRAANLVVGGLALVVGAVLAWHIVFESVMEAGL